MKNPIPILSFCCFLNLFSATLPHQGRIIISGEPFDGTGYFRFALVNSAGSLVWNHEGEAKVPGTDIEITVSKGFYQCSLGDTSVNGMSALPVELFRLDNPLKLRIWFNDGVRGMQQLGEDQPLLVSAYSLNTPRTDEDLIADSLAFEIMRKAEENDVSINELLSRIAKLSANSTTGGTISHDMLPDGLARLDENGTLALSQLPSEVVSSANGEISLDMLPEQVIRGEGGKISHSMLPDGLARLDEGGTLSLSQLPSEVVSSVNGQISLDMLPSSVISSSTGSITSDLLDEGILGHLKPVIHGMSKDLHPSGTRISVDASGRGLSYQWKKDGVVLADAQDSFIIADNNLTDANYSVVVSNPLGNVESDQVSVNEKIFVVSSALDMELLWMSAGSFLMGDDTTPGSGAEPKHLVELTRGFYLGKHEVTQEEYEQIMKDNLYDINATPSYATHDYNLPVENVSWNDVQVFLSILNQKESAAGKLPNGWKYDLPTEAEWEYACRAGTNTRYYWGDSLHVEWGNAQYVAPGEIGYLPFENYYRPSTTITTNPVGTVYYGEVYSLLISIFGPPNEVQWDTIPEWPDMGDNWGHPRGFRDMLGNVMEWTADIPRAYDEFWPQGVPKNAVATAQDVKAIYNYTLNRDPGSAELSFWANGLYTTDFVFQQFILSNEVQANIADGSMGSVVDPVGPDWRGNSHSRVVRGGHFLSHLTQENFNSSSRTISEVLQAIGFSGKPSEKSPFVGFRLALKPIREEKTFEVLDLVSPSLVLKGEGVPPDSYLSFLPDDVALEHAQGEPWVEPGFSAIDTHDGNLTYLVKISGKVDTAVVGIYEIEYFVSDFSGNEATSTRYVKIVSTGSSSLPGEVKVSSQSFFFGREPDVYKEFTLPKASSSTGSSYTFDTSIDMLINASQPGELESANYAMLEHSENPYPFKIVSDGVRWNVLSQNVKKLSIMFGDHKPFADIHKGTHSSDPEDFTSFGGVLYFTASTFEHGRELWKTDGNSTTLVKDIIDGNESSEIRELTVFDGELYFIAGKELWESDGTSEGTSSLNIGLYDAMWSSWVYISFNSLGNLITSGESLYITGQYPDALGQSRNHLFRKKTTEAGWEYWHSIAEPDELTNLRRYDYFNGLWKDSLYFTAKKESGTPPFVNQDANASLWRIDDNSETPVPIVPHADANFTNPRNLKILGDDLYFCADNLNTGKPSIFMLPPPESDDNRTIEIVGNSMGSSSIDGNASDFTELGDKTFFISPRDELNPHLNVLWYFREIGDTSWNIQPLFDPADTATSFPRDPKNLFVHNGKMYFSASDGDQTELWITEGTQEDTVMVDFWEGNYSYSDGFFSYTRYFSSNPHSFHIVNNFVHFVATDSLGAGIWKTNGTDNPNGNVLVKRFQIKHEEQGATGTYDPERIHFHGNSVYLNGFHYEGGYHHHLAGYEELNVPNAFGNELYKVELDYQPTSGSGPQIWNGFSYYSHPSIVIDNDHTYISTQDIHPGIDISNTDYWLPLDGVAP